MNWEPENTVVRFDDLERGAASNPLGLDSQQLYNLLEQARTEASGNTFGFVGFSQAEKVVGRETALSLIVLEHC